MSEGVVEYKVRCPMNSEGEQDMGTLVVMDGKAALWSPIEKEDGGLFQYDMDKPFSTLQTRYPRYVFETEDDEVEMGADGTIAKMDEDQRCVFGWAYVTHDRTGKVVVDKSGDFVDDYREIEKSAYDFVLKSRAGDADHTNVKGADMVESMIFTPEKIAKMGIPEGVVPLGWWVGFKVHDEATWQRVKKGELRAFSIHGSGTRKAVN